MKKLTNCLLISALFSCICGFTFLYSNWKINTDYSIKFSGNGAEGSLSGLKGDVFFDVNNPEASKIDVSVDVSTISTGNATKDKHARGKSWFDAEKYPKIKFTSTSVSEFGAKLIMQGVLELHGVKKEVRIPFVFLQKEEKATFIGSFKINRREFGINGPWMAFSVGDEFTVNFNIPCTAK